MLRNEVLDTAGDLISKDRAAVYGDANEGFEAIADMWTAYLKNHIIDVSLNAADVAAMMVLMKVSRLRYAQEYMDNWVDIAGYAALGGEIAGGGHAE